MKVEQEARASKPNANTENFSEVRAPSSTSPPSPEGFLTTITSQRCYKYTGVPNSTISSTSSLLVIKRPQTLFCKTLFPYKNPCRTMSRNEALVCKEKRKRNQRVLENTSENEREFQHKTKKPSSFESLKLFKLLQIFLVMNLSPNTPIYSRGLGFRDKTYLRPIRKY